MAVVHGLIPCCGSYKCYCQACAHCLKIATDKLKGR